MFGFILGERQYGARHLSPLNLWRTKRAVKEQIRLLQDVRKDKEQKAASRVLKSPVVKN
jgi:hypothetical protein